jgi:hypothetical protein
MENRLTIAKPESMESEATKPKKQRPQEAATLEVVNSSQQLWFRRWNGVAPSFGSAIRPKGRDRRLPNFFAPPYLCSLGPCIYLTTPNVNVVVECIVSPGRKTVLGKFA